MLSRLVLLFALPGLWLGSGCDSGDIFVAQPVRTPLIAYWRDSGGQDGLNALLSAQRAMPAAFLDGVVLDLGFGFQGIRRGSAPDVSGAVAVARMLPSSGLGQNYQVMRPGIDFVDWADDALFAEAEIYFEVAARAIQMAGLKGVFLDHQVTGESNPWSFAGQAPGSNWEQTEVLVRRRARGLMAAFSRGFPTADWILLWGTAELWRQVCYESATLPTHPYGLYPAFVEGMRDALAPGSMVDGFLSSYPARNPDDFATMSHLIGGRRDALEQSWRAGIVTHWYGTGAENGPRSWSSRPVRTCDDATSRRLSVPMRVGFGVLPEYGELNFDLAAVGLSGGGLQPSSLTDGIAAAMRQSQSVVWLRSELYSFWPSLGSLPPYPQVYRDAIAGARAQVRSNPLGL